MTLGTVLLHGPRRGVTLLIPRYSSAGTYPLDMSQYNNLFMSTRIPVRPALTPRESV